MTTPLTPPTFGDKYNVGLTDLGSGYAAGITSAGNSVAGAISSVMGGINQKTGEAQEGILGQKKSSEDYLDALHMHGALTDDEYAKAKTSSLGAQQKIAGQFSADFAAKVAAKYAMEQVQAENAAALTRQGMAGQSAQQVARIGQEYRNREDTTPVRRAPAPNTGVPLPNTYGGNPSLNNPVPPIKLF